MISKKEDYSLEPNLKVHDERDDGAEAYERRVLLPRDHQTKLLRAPLVLARLGPEALRRLHERVEALAPVEHLVDVPPHDGVDVREVRVEAVRVAPEAELRQEAVEGVADDAKGPEAAPPQLSREQTLKRVY